MFSIKLQCNIDDLKSKYLMKYLMMYITYIAQNDFVLYVVVLQTRQAFLLSKIQVLNHFVLVVQYFCQWLHYDNL